MLLQHLVVVLRIKRSLSEPELSSHPVRRSEHPPSNPSSPCASGDKLRLPTEASTPKMCGISLSKPVSEFPTASIDKWLALHKKLFRGHTSHFKKHMTTATTVTTILDQSRAPGRISQMQPSDTASIRGLVEECQSRTWQIASRGHGNARSFVGSSLSELLPLFFPRTAPLIWIRSWWQRCSCSA